MAVKGILFLIVAVLIGGVAAGFYYSIPHDQTMKAANKTVTIGTTTIAVEVADTEALRELGLSGHAPLAANAGMWFIFDTPGKYGFWMKDMTFPLDIIFIDATGTVVTIAGGATPESYRESTPVVFYPTAPIEYVLEVPAGYAAAHGITEGSKAVYK